MCGRLYLYKKYISASNVLVNIMIGIIDGLESEHCKTSARHWRLRAKKEGGYFPERYNEYLKPGVA